jgi:DNA-binding transcriptional LysR family regulator
MTIRTDQRDLEFSLLRTFLAVVGHGSMARTAAAIAKTQPAVSQQMQRLESIVGQKLFYRSRGGVTLTCHGELLVAYANRVIELNEQVLARLREESASGSVCLGASEETALAGLALALKRFQKTHPEVELKLIVAAPARLKFLLESGALDFVIGDPTRIADPPLIEWRSRLAWLASTDFSIDPFKPLPLVMCESTNCWHDEILSSLRAAGWEWRVVFESASLDATLAALDSGMGISALLPETVRNTRISEIKYVRLPALPEVRFGMFRSRTAPTRARALMETALAASLRAVAGNLLTQSTEMQAWSTHDDTLRHSGALQELNGALL